MIYQDIFEEIVRLAIGHRMVDSQILYIDSTYLKANANKNKFINQVVQESTQHYLDDLEQSISAERHKHGQKPLKAREEKEHDDEPPKGSSGKSRNIKVSSTDLDSGYMHQDSKPKGFFYLDHQTVDSTM